MRPDASSPVHNTKGVILCEDKLLIPKSDSALSRHTVLLCGEEELVWVFLEGGDDGDIFVSFGDILSEVKHKGLAVKDAFKGDVAVAFFDICVIHHLYILVFIHQLVCPVPDFGREKAVACEEGIDAFECNKFTCLYIAYRSGGGCGNGYVEEVDDWCFDRNRKSGDVAIIENVYGYTIVYFVGAYPY